MKDIISTYKVAESSPKEVWYIPKVNTDVFRDGNGVPLLRREVHGHTLSGTYKAIGCDSTTEHGCPLCEAWIDGMYKLHTYLEAERNKMEAYGISKDKIESNMELIKYQMYNQVQFKKHDYVYMVVAVLENYSSGEMNGTEFVPSFTMKLVRMTIDTYNRDFRAELLADDNGVLFDVSYEDTENIIDKSKSRKVTKSNLILSSTQKFENRVLKEFRSIHMLDLIKLSPELKPTSFDYAKAVATIAEQKVTETVSEVIDSSRRYN